MTSTGFTLPVISIAPWISNPTDPGAREEAVKAIHQSCLDYGFFYLDISSYVDASETDDLLRLAREFFALPQKEKDLLALGNEDNARGYARLHENVTAGKADNHEGLDIYRPVEKPDKTKPLWGSNQWPAIPGFREKYEAWVEKMKALGAIVMEAMAEGLRLTADECKSLLSKVDDSFWVMRVIGYPQLPDDHDGISCGAHKDYGCLTFLFADTTPAALQVFLHKLPNEQDNELQKGMWINADPVPGCVVCNIGEMWEIWTNGLYKSTLHRVIHKGENYRISLLSYLRRIPFFFEPNFDALVEPLPTAMALSNRTRTPTEPSADEEQSGAVPRKTYRPVVYGDFLMKKVGHNFSTGGGKYS